MTDSTAVIPISEIRALGETLAFAQKSIAVHWFMGNVSIIITVASIIALIVLASKVHPNEGVPIKHMKMSTQKTIISAGIFIVGLILMQIMLKLSGVILWSILYGVAMSLHLKWSSWFIRRDYKIPIGWILCLFAVISITTLSFNFIPSMVSANENVPETLYSTAR